MSWSPSVGGEGRDLPSRGGVVHHTANRCWPEKLRKQGKEGRCQEDRNNGQNPPRHYITRAMDTQVAAGQPDASSRWALEGWPSSQGIGSLRWRPYPTPSRPWPSRSWRCSWSGSPAALGPPLGGASLAGILSWWRWYTFYLGSICGTVFLYLIFGRPRGEEPVSKPPPLHSQAAPEGPLRPQRGWWPPGRSSARAPHRSGNQARRAWLPCIRTPNRCGLPV